MLYMLNGQKEHTRAFFVWTVWMWESIPILECVGEMSQFPYLYILVLPCMLMWMGFSINTWGRSTEVVAVATTSIASSSMDALGSTFVRLVPVGVGVGVVAILRYLSSCGSSPAPTSKHIFLNDTHPLATNWWPQATVQIAEIITT